MTIDLNDEMEVQYLRPLSHAEKQKHFCFKSKTYLTRLSLHSIVSLPGTPL